MSGARKIQPVVSLPDIDSADLAGPAGVVSVPISDLAPLTISPRMSGENADHVRALAESAAALPPIVVHRPTMQVIDGLHRLRAAQLRGESTIAVVFFDGTAAEAFVLAVKSNTAHGLPLSLADRRAAAQHILRSHPHWSDRAIAVVAGLSPKTVSAIRRRTAVEIPQSSGRVARNGVFHRGIGSAGRRAAVELFTADPDASARKVALAAGISVTTAKDVRRRLRQGQDPVPSRAADRSKPTSQPSDPTQVLQRLRRDPALRFADSGRTLLRWLEPPVGDGADWGVIVAAIPRHCAPSLAELARRRADDWQHMARLLDQRA